MGAKAWGMCGSAIGRNFKVGERSWTNYFYGGGKRWDIDISQIFYDQSCLHFFLQIENMESAYRRRKISNLVWAGDLLTPDWAGQLNAHVKGRFDSQRQLLQ